MSTWQYQNNHTTFHPIFLIPRHCPVIYEAWECSWNWKGGGRGSCPKKKLVFKAGEIGPKNRPWMSSHPNIITIKFTITIWILWQKVSDYSKIQFLTFWKFWFFPESMPISLHPPTHVVCYLNTVSSHYYNPHS